MTATSAALVHLQNILKNYNCLANDLPLRLGVFSVNADDEAAAFPLKEVNPVGFKLKYARNACP